MERFFTQGRLHTTIVSFFLIVFMMIFFLCDRNVFAQTRRAEIQSPNQVDSLLRILATTKHDTTRIDVSILLSQYHRSVKRNFDSAYFYAEFAYELSTKIGFNHGIASSLLQRAYLYHYQVKDTLAEKDFQSSIKLYQILNDNLGLANAYTGLGIIYTHSYFNYAQALSFLTTAINIYQRLGDTLGARTALFQIGWIYDIFGNNSKAIEYYSRSLHLSEITGRMVWIGYAALTLGDTYVKTGEYDKAESLFTRSRQIYKELGDEVMILSVDIGQGKMYVQQGKMVTAQELFERILKKCEKANMTGFQTLVLYQLANIHSLLKNHKQALSYAQRGFALCDSVEWGQKLPRADFLIVLSNSYEHLGNPQKALEYYRKAEIIKQSVLNAHVIQQLADINIQNEFDKQNAIMDLLRSETLLKDVELRNKNLSQWLLVVILLSVTLGSLWLYQLYHEKKKTTNDLTVKNTFLLYKTQMQDLESQLAPHFLFNSLSALGGLISRNAKKEAIEFLENLALTYRYVLTHKQKHLVTLEAEVDFVNAYMYLFTTRFREGLQVQLEIDTKFIHYSLPPMTLQLLVENALKHNTATASTPLHIFIQTEDNESGAQLVVRNNLQLRNTHMEYKAMMSMSKDFQVKEANKETTQLGLQNLFNRYRMYAYRLPSIEQTETEFIVSVPLLRREEITLVS